jgi:hypothetical protein
MTIASRYSAPVIAFWLVIGIAVFVGFLYLVATLRGNTEEKRDRNHWMASFAKARKGVFTAKSRGTAPSGGVDPEQDLGLSLAETPAVRAIEFVHRDREVVGADYLEHVRKSHRDDRWFPSHSVQVRTKPGVTTYLVPDYKALPDSAMDRLAHVKTFDREFDGNILIRAADRDFLVEILTPELRRWMLDDPRSGKWPIAIEAGYVRTWSRGYLTRKELFAEADYLIDLVDRLPDRFWDH